MPTIIAPRKPDARQVPPPRLDPEDTRLDSQRIEYAYSKWHAQDDALRHRDRQIEENVRMLSGQQWSIFHPRLGRWVDPSQWMTDEERRWRQMPVFNRLLPWFIITHARMTENPPIITFIPGPDRIDAELAETMDILFKAKWRDVGMIDVWDRAAAWLIVAGSAYIQSRIDLSLGDWQPMVGIARLPLLDAEGNPQVDPLTGEPITQDVPNVPLDMQGNPLAKLFPDGLQTLGEPHVVRRGDLVVDMLSPLEVRGQWGPQPWHKKRWHAMKSFLTPEEIYDRWQIWCEPNVPRDKAGELHRVLFGSGWFGAASQAAGAEMGTSFNIENYVEVLTLWEAPSNLFEATQEAPGKPGGRLLIVTREKVLQDGERPAPYRYTSPIRCFDFIRLPGRPPGGSTPQEAMNPVQRAYNRRWMQILTHGQLVTNPKAVIDEEFGLEASQWTNRPGEAIVGRIRPGVRPIEWIAPPPLSDDVYKTQALLLQEIMQMGSLIGTEGHPPTSDASGELIKELRFNADRFLGPTMRRAVEEMARMVEDWMVLLPTIYDDETVISYAGEDNVARTIVVRHQLFDTGRVNVIPDLESMLPEGRGERSARIYKMWLDGAFGPPLESNAIRTLHDLLRFPHMSRTAKPGGIDRITADQENGRLLQGEPAETIPTYEWYDDFVHLERHEAFMKSPEFLKLPPEIQAEFIAHRERHLFNLQQKLQAQLGAQGLTNGNATGGRRQSELPAEMIEESRVLPTPASERMPRGPIPGGQHPTAAGQSQTEPVETS